jgi:hypothetical protein
MEYKSRERRDKLCYILGTDSVDSLPHGPKEAPYRCMK